MMAVIATRFLNDLHAFIAICFKVPDQPCLRRFISVAIVFVEDTTSRFDLWFHLSGIL